MCPEHWYIATVYDDGHSLDANAAYIAACSPDRILALLDVVDVVRGYMNATDSHDFEASPSTHGSTFEAELARIGAEMARAAATDSLRATLAALEPT
jgi:hypothetical protein